MSEYKSFTKHIGLIGLTKVLYYARSIILLPILTKSLGAQGYGLWAQASVTIGLLFPLISLGLHGALIRFLAVKKDKKEIQEGFYSILFFILITGLIACSGMLIFSRSIADMFFDQRVDIVRLLAFIILVQSINMVFLSYFKAFKQMGKYSSFFLFQAYGELALITYLIFSGYGILEVIWSVLIIKLITLLIMFILVMQQIGIRFPKFVNIKEYLNYSLPMVPSNISAWFINSSDRYVIAYFLGVIFVGLYSPAYTLGGIIMIFIEPFAFVLLPYLSKLYDEKKYKEVKKYIFYSLKYFLVAAIPSAVGISLLSKPLLSVLSTQEIASKAYFITPFIATSIVLFGIIVIISQNIALVKKTKIIGMSWILSASLNLALNIVLIPTYGIIAAAITTLIAYVLTLIILTLFSLKYFTFKTDWLSLIKCGLASFIMATLIYIINPQNITQIIFTILISIVVYSSIFLLLKGLHKEEYKFFKSFIKSS